MKFSIEYLKKQRVISHLAPGSKQLICRSHVALSLWQTSEGRMGSYKTKNDCVCTEQLSFGALSLGFKSQQVKLKPCYLRLGIKLYTYRLLAQWEMTKDYTVLGPLVFIKLHQMKIVPICQNNPQLKITHVQWKFEYRPPNTWHTSFTGRLSFW